MTSKYMVTVYNASNEPVARVNINSKLDQWSGGNWYYQTPHYHLGYTRLRKSKQFVLIHYSNYQDDEPYAWIATPEELLRAAIKSNTLDDVVNDYPELEALAREIFDEEEEIQKKRVRGIGERCGDE